MEYDAKDKPIRINCRIDKNAFQRLTSGETKGFVELNQIFWKTGGQFHYEDIEHKNTGSTGVMIINIERITSLSLLAPEYVKQALSKEARDRASRLSEPN